MPLDIVIMAAGKGTRMKSALPKVLHRLAGTSLLHHVMGSAAAVGPNAILVVTGNGAEAVEAAVDAYRSEAAPTAAGRAVAGGADAAAAAGGASGAGGANESAPAVAASGTASAGPGALAQGASGGPDRARAPEVRAAAVRCVRQAPQLGTGHAVQQALPHLQPGGVTLVLNGDTPLIEPSSLRALVDEARGGRLALLSVELADPTGYGRIVRVDDGVATGAVLRIVEEKDATPAERSIREVYTGVMAAPTAALARWLPALTNANAQGEYYLTDVVGMAAGDGTPIVARRAANEIEVLGVNSPAQLAELERRHQRRQAEAQMAAGVRLADPARFDLRGTLSCGQDVEIDVNCVFEGRVSVGDGVRIGAHCVIRDAVVGAGAVLHPYTHVEGATIGAGALIGPYARLRPGAVLAEEVHVGNFVEIKNATLARGAKANHLAYLGDATVGERVNFGAGSITANYDGAAKHRTTIGADAHVGSNCVLVAPLVVGEGATIGGGSTVAKEAPAGQLTVARARQVSYPNWERPRKKVP